MREDFSGGNRERHTEFEKVKELRDFFSGYWLKTRIRQTLRSVNEHQGREFGFLVLKDTQTGRLHFTDVVSGTHDESVNLGQATRELGEKIVEKMGYDEYNPPLAPFFDFHMHPILGGNEAVGPSSSDMESSAYHQCNDTSPDVDISPVSVVGQREDGSTVICLAYQLPVHYKIYEHPTILEELKDSLEERRDSMTQEDLTALLEHYQIKTALVTFVDGEFPKGVVDRLASTFGKVSEK